MNSEDLVDVRLFYSRAEATAAAGILHSHGVPLRVVSPKDQGQAPFPTAAAPYRLQVPSGEADRVGELLGDSGSASEPPSAEFDGRSQWPEVSQKELAAGLMEIRRRRRAVWMLFLLFVPAILLFNVFGKTGAAVGSALYIAVTCVVGWRLLYSRCPRCRGYFHKTRFGYNMITRECLQCHLDLRSEGGAVSLS